MQKLTGFIYSSYEPSTCSCLTTLTLCIVYGFSLLVFYQPTLPQQLDCLTAMKNKCHLDLVKNKCNLDKDTMIRLVASNLLMTTHLDVFSTELSPQSMVQWKWFITEFQLGWRNRKGKVGFPTLTHHHSPHTLTGHLPPLMAPIYHSFSGRLQYFLRMKHVAESTVVVLPGCFRGMAASYVQRGHKRITLSTEVLLA